MVNSAQLLTIPHIPDRLSPLAAIFPAVAVQFTRLFKKPFTQVNLVVDLALWYNAMRILPGTLTIF